MGRLSNERKKPVPPILAGIGFFFDFSQECFILIFQNDSDLEQLKLFNFILLVGYGKEAID